MAAQVEESLKMPLHWRNIWTEARNFIDIYQRDHDKMNSVLLEFAKLNYNILQSVYLKELQELAKWDVIVELPEYMKPIYTALYNHVSEVAHDTLDDKSMDILPFIRKLFEGYMEAVIEEAKRIYSGNNPIPTDEYLKVSWITIGGVLSINYAVVGVDEIERGETVNFINCYMIEEGVSEEEARDHMEVLKRDLWKKLNKYIIEYSVDASSIIAKVVVNMVRVTHDIYRGGKYDYFGVRPKADLVSTLNSIFEPIPM
ncbi:hypothetical protein COLO4_27757 [Corchorus olitorius]|uniref:Terpene synthase metal-binding domain-containing protein n=1 Tax=Corchorus olitorius TaxID=93759 RepID=A0A1R3HPC8_9ROSI|nr:hypothetical protein COLO4_27757 [Corchorus olitorius]